MTRIVDSVEIKYLRSTRFKFYSEAATRDILF